MGMTLKAEEGLGNGNDVEGGGGARRVAGERQGIRGEWRAFAGCPFVAHLVLAIVPGERLRMACLTGARGGPVMMTGAAARG